MKKNYIIGSMIIIILFVSFYRIYTFYNQNQKLTECILSNIEYDSLETLKLSNQNSNLLTKIIKSKKLTYDNIISLNTQHKKMKYTFNKIIKEIIVIKPQKYLDKHIVTNDPMTALIKIPILYNQYIGELHNDVGEISLDETDIKEFKLILKYYELYSTSFKKIDGQIDIKKDFWIDKLNMLYNKNLEQIK